jgi:hypothetical protein
MAGEGAARQSPYRRPVADIVLGIFAILAGLIFCFSGRLWLRIVFPIWGAFAGFSFGAGLIAGLGGDRFLGEVLGWMVGLVFAVLFAVLAYSFYAIAVVIVMTSIGFAIGSGLVVALGIDWNWVAVLVGVLVGAVLCVGAILADVPMLVVTILSAVAGAIGVTAGLMLVTGAMDSADFTGGGFADRVQDDWWWYALFLVVALVGIVVQVRDAAAMRRSLRATWFTSAPATPSADLP